MFRLSLHKVMNKTSLRSHNFRRNGFHMYLLYVLVAESLGHLRGLTLRERIRPWKFCTKYFSTLWAVYKSELFVWFLRLCSRLRYCHVLSHCLLQCGKLSGKFSCTVNIVKKFHMKISICEINLILILFYYQYHQPWQLFWPVLLSFQLCIHSFSFTYFLILSLTILNEEKTILAKIPINFAGF